MKKVVIDAGHGGVDSGAIGSGIVEKDLTLKISKYIYDRLKELGIDTKITRETDETISPSDRVNRILNSFGNNDDVIVISNHINAGRGDGAEVIYALRNDDTLSNLILNELSNAGQNVRRVYQKRLPSNPSKDYYFIQRDTGNTEPVIVEYGFLDSTKDDVNQLKNDWDKYAEAVVKAITEYIGTSYEPGNQDYTYQVVSGDTLWNIAKKFNTTVYELKRINNLDTSLLKIGQILKISEPIETNVNTYIVKKGDTLYNIAKVFGTTVDDIIELNNLVSTNLSIGQNIKIPVNNNFYQVVSGDTLWNIARKFNTTVNKIKEDNNLISDLLSIGQILLIK